MSELSNANGNLSLDALMATLAIGADGSTDEPDVWWGPNGIDALCWADGIPYEFAVAKGDEVQ